MELEKKNLKETFEIIVNPITTEANLQKQLEIPQQFSKFKLTFTNCFIQQAHLLQIKQFLNQQIEIEELQFYLSQTNNLDLWNFFQHFSSFTSTSSLILSIRKSHFNLSHHIQLGDCLKNFKNLQNLTIILFDKQQIEYINLNLSSLYQNAPKLLSLTFEATGWDQYQIEELDGIKYLQNLETLQVDFYLNRNCLKRVVRSLNEQLSSLMRLKTLKLQFWLNNNHRFKETIQTLQIMPNLENLSLKLFLEENSQDLNIISQSFPFFMKLKELEFSYTCTANESIVGLIDSISQIPNLEKTSLSLSIKNKDNYDQDVINLMISISKILTLIELTISFEEDETLQINQMINMIGFFKDLKHLEYLGIYFKIEDKEELFEKEYIQNAMNTLRNIKKFRFEIQDSYESFFNPSCPQEMIEIFQQATKMEDLSIAFGFQYDQNKQKQNPIHNLIGNMNKLQFLKIQFTKDYQINSKDLSLFFSNLKVNTHLEKIDFDFKGQGNFDNLIFQSLSDSLSSLNNLSTFIFDLNEFIDIDEKGIGYLGICFKFLTKLTSIYLEFKLTSKQIDSFISMVSNLKDLLNLNYLTICLRGKIEISKQKQFELFQQFILPKKLEYLNFKMKCNGFESENLIKLISEISLLECINHISAQFGKMSISNEEVNIIINKLLNLKLLTRLNLKDVYTQSLQFLQLFKQNSCLQSIHFDTFFSNFANQVIWMIKNENNNWKYEEGLRLELNLVERFNSQFQLSFENLEIITKLDIKIDKLNCNGTKINLSSLLSLESLVNLKYLKFWLETKDNELNSQNILILGQAICSLHKLESLSLKIFQSNSQEVWNESNHFLNEISNLQKLSHFELLISSNFQETFDLNGLVKNLEKVQRLFKLQITFEGKIQIKDESNTLIDMLTKKDNGLCLLKFYVKTNSFQSAEQQEKIYSCISKLNNLKQLDILIPHQKLQRNFKKMKRIVELKFKNI